VENLTPHRLLWRRLTAAGLKKLVRGDLLACDESSDKNPLVLWFPEVYRRIVTEETKGGVVMSKGKGVSGHTHTRQQLNDYANQHNPNNPAYRADQENQTRMASTNRKDQKYWIPDYDYSYALDKDDY